MKILYDHQMFSKQNYGGISKYFCELLKNIPQEHQFGLSLLVSSNNYLRENYSFFKIPNILPYKNFKWKDLIEKRIYSLNSYYSLLSIKENNFDLFHPTYYDTYFLGKVKKPYVITVHDLIYFKFANDFKEASQIKSIMRKSIKNAKRIVAVSENTRNDLIEILNIHPEKIDVIYHGYNKPVQNKNSGFHGRYILFVGRRGLYKNFKKFSSAISKLLLQEKDIKLVCIGPPFNSEEITNLTKLGILQQCIAINVGENTLNELYSNALVFVFPSLYEGFGMPILEAFANDCPVCLSNTSCFPEIAGNAGAYFDPNNEESILNSIEKVIFNDSFSNQIREAGHDRLNQFSWEKTARETITSYQKAV